MALVTEEHWAFGETMSRPCFGYPDKSDLHCRGAQSLLMALNGACCRSEPVADVIAESVIPHVYD